MKGTILDIVLILFPVAVVLTFLSVRFLRFERKISNLLIIFAAIFGILILLYLIFQA